MGCFFAIQFPFYLKSSKSLTTTNNHQIPFVLEFQFRISNKYLQVQEKQPNYKAFAISCSAAHFSGQTCRQDIENRFSAFSTRRQRWRCYAVVGTFCEYTILNGSFFVASLFFSVFMFSSEQRIPFDVEDNILDFH
jgi:hypothetical protein